VKDRVGKRWQGAQVDPQRPITSFMPLASTNIPSIPTGRAFGDAAMVAAP